MILLYEFDYLLHLALSGSAMPYESLRSCPIVAIEWRLCHVNLFCNNSDSSISYVHVRHKTNDGSMVNLRTLINGGRLAFADV